MYHLMGAVLLAAGGAWFGFQAAAGLRQRVWALRDLAAGLALLERELELNAPPLPELMARLAESAPGAARTLFRRCISEEERPFAQTWSRAVEAQPALHQEDRQMLAPLGQSLGRYDIPAQVQAVSAVRRTLEEAIAQAEHCRDRQGRVYQVLGLSGGIFLVILLL